MSKQVLDKHQIKAIRRRLFWYSVGFNRHWRRPCEALRAWLGTFEAVNYDELLGQVHRIFADPRRQKRALNLDGSFVKIMLDMLHEVVGPMGDDEHTRRDSTTVAALKALEDNTEDDGGRVVMTGVFLDKHMQNVITRHCAPKKEGVTTILHHIYHSVVENKEASTADAS